MRMTTTAIIWGLLVSAGITSAHTETPEEWITLGTRVHGGFGAFIPLGIRIGLDAVQRLNAKPRELTDLLRQQGFALRLLRRWNCDCDLRLGRPALADDLPRQRT